jgi:hypothetical protein
MHPHLCEVSRLGRIEAEQARLGEKIALDNLPYAIRFAEVP